AKLNAWLFYNKKLETYIKTFKKSILNNEVIKMDENIKEKIDSMEKEIEELKEQVKSIKRKEDFTGNVIFKEPIKNYYNR
ncbi:hypothetical protein, partial [Clostridium botulinum]|uniref:hypothetical protein n=1 Tax=Clostridium botulinum TaxID=1491 RepID=UPI00057C8D10